MTTCFPTPPLFGTSLIVSKLAIILGSWAGFAAISGLYLDRMSPSVDVQNTSGELQLELKFIFRAHPSWRSGRSWHDWALFSWTNMDGTPVPIPGQIITFIWFAEEDISKIQHLSYVSGDTPGLYAMIESLERPLSVAKTYDGVVAGGSKQLTTNEFHKRCRTGMSLTAPNLCLVPVDTIYEPIAAIPDEGGFPGDFLFIRPVKNWGFGFTQLIEDNEASELAELEAISDTLSNLELMDDIVFESDPSENGSGSSDTSSS
jgi:hypothetical protein